MSFPISGPLDTDTIFTMSPDVGADCICSRCGKPILRGVPIRMFTDEKPMREYRYHMSCLGIQVDESDNWDEELYSGEDFH